MHETTGQSVWNIPTPLPNSLRKWRSYSCEWQNRSWSNKYTSHALCVLYQKLQINNKSKFWKTVRLTSVGKKQNKTQLQSFQYPLSLFICAFTGPYSVITTYFQRFDRSFAFFFMFHSIWCQYADYLNFDRWRQLRKCPCNIVKANRFKMCIERVSLNHCTYFVDCLKRLN